MRHLVFDHFAGARIVVARLEKDAEHLLDLVDFFRRESPATQTDEVGSDERQRVVGRFHERRDIFADQRSSAEHHVGPDPAELVNRRVSAEDRPVLDFDFSGQRNAVDDHAVVSYGAIVSDMRVSHDQRVASHFGHSFGRRTAVDGGAFADRRVVADLHGRVFAAEFQILRYAGDYGRGVYFAVVSQPCAVQDHGSRADPATVADHDIGCNVCKRFDGYAFSQFCIFGNMG